MTPIALLTLTSHLAENRQLKRVSLAWNFLTAATKKIEHFEDLTPEEQRIYEQYSEKNQGNL